mgnify:CR=1 FL=1
MIALAADLVYRNAFPLLMQDVTLAMVVGKGLVGVCLGIGLTTWVGLCRLLRGEYIKHRDRQYVLAARSVALDERRIARFLLVGSHARISALAWELDVPLDDETFVLVDAADPVARSSQVRHFRVNGPSPAKRALKWAWAM